MSKKKVEYVRITDLSIEDGIALRNHWFKNYPGMSYSEFLLTQPFAREFIKEKIKNYESMG